MTHPGTAPARPPGLERRSGTVPRPARRSRAGRNVVATFVMLLCGVCIAGAPYYRLPAAGRVRSPLHMWFKPAGYIGQSAGLLALAIFLFLWLYPLRKKYRALAWTGSVARWLDVHVLAALSLPLLVAIHAAWRFAGLIGLGFWSMLVVWLSGVVGRYIYARIPRSKAGVELTIEEIGTRREALLAEIVEASGLDARLVQATLAVRAPAPGARRGAWETLRGMVADDFARRRAARALRRAWRAHARHSRRDDGRLIAEVLHLARREMSLEQQARMLDASHDVFRYWHVLHRPVAVAALVAVVVHVAVVVALGATWLW
jgi:hypothetical protein